MADRIQFSSAGAVRKSRPVLSAEDANFHGRIICLVRDMQMEADRLDTIFTQRADLRALQGGAIDEEAERLRQAARNLRQIATIIE